MNTKLNKKIIVIIILVLLLFIGDYIPFSTITNRYENMNVKFFFDRDDLLKEFNNSNEIITNVENLGFNEWTDIYITSSYVFSFETHNIIITPTHNIIITPSNITTANSSSIVDYK